MSRTNLDILLQVTAPIGERTGSNLLRSDKLGAGFTDHLSQVSATPGATDTAGRAGNRPSPNDSSSNGYEPPTTEAPRHETATEFAPDDRDDPDAREPRSVEDSTVAQVTTSSDDPGKVTGEADESEHDTDADTVDSEEAAVAIAGTVGNNAEVETAIAKLGESTAPQGAPAKDASLGEAAKRDQSDRSAAAKHIPIQRATTDAPTDHTTRTKADAPVDNMPVTPADAVKAPAAPGLPLDESASPRTAMKLRAVKPKAAAETEKQPQRGEDVANGVDGDKQISDAGLSPHAAKAEADAASVDLASNESTQAERDAAPEDNREANTGSSARQRPDTAALANKVPIAALANGAAPQPAIRTQILDSTDGTPRTEKSAAVDSIGGGANRLHANAGPAKRGSRTDSADEVSRVDPARFVGRVAKAFHTAQERGGTLQIRLSPPELGAMRLELTVKDGVMTAALETETASARRVLLEHLPALRDRLAEQNIRVERFDVDVRREGTGGQADPRAAQDQQQPQQGHSEPRRRQTAQPPMSQASRQTNPTVPARISDNGINLVA